MRAAEGAGDRFEPVATPGRLHPAFRADAVHNALATMEPEAAEDAEADLAEAGRR